MYSDETPEFLRGVREITSYDGVRTLLKSKSVEPATHQESRDFVGGTVLTLTGDEHFFRRRLESPVLARESLKEYEKEILTPTIDRCLGDVLAATPPGEVPRADLNELVGRMLLEIGAAVVGLDDVDSIERSGRLFKCRDALMLATIVEFELVDKERIIAEGLEAKEIFDREFLAPSRARREKLIADARERGDEEALAELEGADLISQMLLHWNDEWDDDLLSRECILYLVASGHSTTTAVTHTVNELTKWFEDHPEDLDRRFDPEFLLKAGMEALRLHSPAPGILRRAIERFEIEDHGETIVLEEGELVSANLSAASRDESHFGPGWASFDPYRDVKRVINRYGHAFGGGHHVCIGRQFVLGTFARDDMSGDYTGVLVRVLKSLYEAGVRIEPGRPPVKAHSAHDRFETFSVAFDRLNAAVTRVTA